MRHSGNIALTYDDGVLDFKPYECRSHRNKIIDQWRRLYGKRIEKCCIVFSPHTDINAIKPNGQNLKYPQGIKRKAFDPYLKMAI